MLLAQRWIIARLRKRRFTSIAELNVAIEECLEIINNKPFKKLVGSRASLFEAIDRAGPAHPCRPPATRSASGTRSSVGRTTTFRRIRGSTRCPSPSMGGPWTCGSRP